VCVLLCRANVTTWPPIYWSVSFVDSGLYVHSIKQRSLLLSAPRLYLVGLAIFSVCPWACYLPPTPGQTSSSSPWTTAFRAPHLQPVVAVAAAVSPPVDAYEDLCVNGWNLLVKCFKTSKLYNTCTLLELQWRLEWIALRCSRGQHLEWLA